MHIVQEKIEHVISSQAILTNRDAVLLSLSGFNASHIYPISSDLWKNLVLQVPRQIMQSLQGNGK